MHSKIDEASTLTISEYALLLASIEARLEPKKYNCRLCAAKYKPDKKHIKRKPKGCYDYSTRVYRLENILYKTCLGNYNKSIGFYTEALSMYEKGMLPFKGTLSEQPNKIIEIFNIIEQRREEKKPKDG